MSSAGINKTAQYLSFTLEDEVFAVDVSQVREILDLGSITRVPRTPDYMRGVINLRGSLVPVLDLRLQLGMSVTEDHLGTCIIVVEVRMDDTLIVLGALADSVQEVIEIEPEHIEDVPRLGTRLNNEFIKGMGKLDRRFVMILDIDKIFNNDELTIVQDSIDN